jgi:hypothetical protein
MSDLPITVETDRRELWWLENFLAANATNERQRERHQRLRAYLVETCVHEFADVGGWGGCPSGTHQCHWCNLATFPTDPNHYDLLRTARERNLDA